MNMENDNAYIDFYSGSEISIMGLRSKLEAIDVYGIVQNDINSGRLAGFAGSAVGAVRLKIKAEDLEKSKPILDAFLEQN